LVIIMLSIWPITQCQPEPACEQAASVQAAMLLTAIVAIAAAIVWIVRTTILWLAERREDDGKATGFRLATLAAALGFASIGIPVWGWLVG